MIRWPTVGLIGRVTIWLIAALASLLAAATVAALIAVPATIIAGDRPALFGLSIAVVVVSTLWPGLLTTSLILVDRGLFLSPSRRLLRHAVLWGILPSAIICAAWIAGWGPFSFKDFRLDQDGERSSRTAFWYYITPALAAAVIGGSRITEARGAHCMSDSYQRREVPMGRLQPGDKVRIVDMPPRGSRFIGAVATVVPSGGTGRNDDDLLIRTEGGDMLDVKEHQLEKLAD